MKKRDLLKHIAFLRERAELNKLVIFVGSGVSRNVPGMSSWSEIIEKMAETINYEKCNHCKSAEKCKEKCKKCPAEECIKKCANYNEFSTDEFLKIPQYVFNRKPKIYNSIIGSMVSDKIIPDFSIAKAIFEINPSHIITTNYDKLLESSESEFRKQYDVVIKDKDLLNTHSAKYIIKMHGDISDLKTIVLKEQDYLEYSQKHVLMELFIKSLLVDHTFLFLGYSLNDYNVKLIMSWINYLRSQNRVITQKKKIGYIVLDEKSVNNDTKKYFHKNNLEVLNIQSIPVVSDIPKDLSKDKGKRLYSFLRIIKDSSLDELLSPQETMDEAIEYISKHKIYDYQVLMAAIHIADFQKRDTILQIYSEDSFERVRKYLEDEKNGETLQQLLKNVGIYSIENIEGHERRVFSINDEPTDESIADECYLLYLQNDYNGIISLFEEKRDKIDGMQKAFYKQFMFGKAAELMEDYSDLDFENMSTDEKVAYLHNTEMISALSRYKYDFSRVKNYINNIASNRERQFYQYYLDMYEGNRIRRFNMMVSLSILKKNVLSNSTLFLAGISYGELYNIQNPSLTFYNFLFVNRLIEIGFSDANTFFHDYIEAVICASSEEAEKTVKIFGENMQYHKYGISMIDIDIITKFCSTKELSELLIQNYVSNFRMDVETTEHLLLCFINMVNSVVESGTFGYCQSNISVLANLSMILGKSVLDDRQLIEIRNAFEKLFMNKQFDSLFWNILCNDLFNCLKAFSQLGNRIGEISNIDCIKRILECPAFFDVVANYFYEVKKLVKVFIGKGDNFRKELYNIVDGEKDSRKKIKLLRLFFDKPVSGKKGNEYKHLLLENYSLLDNDDVYSFVFGKWIVPPPEEATNLIYSVLNSYRGRNKNVQSFPDPIERSLERVYIFYISGIMDSIDELEEMSAEYPHLDFLLHPKEFDYRKVDFSNYMWQNFAKSQKYLELFCKNKELIIPTIEERITRKKETEFERKILYGHFYKGKVKL